MRITHLIALIAVPLQSACAQEAPAAQEVVVDTPDDAEIFTAAGFSQTDGAWGKCGDPGTMSYTPGSIDQRGDFNLDGQPDAIVSEGSVYCFGAEEVGYTLVSRNAAGQWAIIDERPGFAQLLETSGGSGWPDIIVGGPGFCHPVVRWNGSEYALDRHEYEGRPCAQ